MIGGRSQRQQSQISDQDAFLLFSILFLPFVLYFRWSFFEMAQTKKKNCNRENGVSSPCGADGCFFFGLRLVRNEKKLCFSFFFFARVCMCFCRGVVVCAVRFAHSFTFCLVLFVLCGAFLKGREGPWGGNRLGYYY